MEAASRSALNSMPCCGSKPTLFFSRFSDRRASTLFRGFWAVQWLTADHAFCCCRALQKCGVTAEDVNYVNAHATSTKAGDLAEYKALRKSIPHEHVRINGTKSMIGHLLGGAGAVEAIAAVQAIRTGGGPLPSNGPALC